MFVWERHGSGPAPAATTGEVGTAALVAAIEGVEHDTSPAALAGALRAFDRLHATLVGAVGDFDRRGLYELDHATSTVAWLRQHSGLAPSTAATMVNAARRLRDLPVTSAAWADQTLTGAHVAAIVASVRDRTVGQFAEHEGELVPLLARLAPHQAALAMRHWAARAEALAEANELSEQPQHASLSATFDGSWLLQATLAPEAGAIVAAALRIASSDDVDGEEVRPVGQRTADALVDVCRHFLDHQQLKPRGRHRPHLNVIIDLADLERRGTGRTIDGAVLDPTTIERLCCDANVHRVIRSGRSAVLDYGHATQTIPVGLWNAVVLRDQQCRYPGCDRPPNWCEAHHIQPWSRHGPTRLDNLALLCSRHHYIVHQPGIAMRLSADGSLHVTRPDGRSMVSHPHDTLPYRRAG